MLLVEIDHGVVQEIVVLFVAFDEGQVEEKPFEELELLLAKGVEERRRRRLRLGRHRASDTLFLSFIFPRESLVIYIQREEEED